MLYFLLAVISSVMISVIMRLSETRTCNNLSMLACNYAAGVVLAAVMNGSRDLLPQTEGVGFALGFGAVSGLLYLAGFLLLQWNIRKNGVVLSATFMKLGVLVPTVMAIVVFGEKPGLTQIMGILLAVVAILLIQFERGHGKAASSAGLVLLLLAGGMADGTSKIFEAWGNLALKDHFLFYTFVVALITCIGASIASRQSLLPVDMLFGLAIGIPNYFSARFLLMALEHIPAVIAYPAFSVSTIVAVTLISAVFFQERLSRRQITALGVILLSLALLNL